MIPPLTQQRDRQRLAASPEAAVRHGNRAPAQPGNLAGAFVRNHYILDIPAESIETARMATITMAENPTMDALDETERGPRMKRPDGSGWPR